MEIKLCYDKIYEKSGSLRQVTWEGFPEKVMFQMSPA